MASPLDAVTAFLLKHPPAELARGELTLAPALPWLVVALLVAAGIGLTVSAVRTLRGTSTRDRWTLGLLRGAAFLLLGLCLLRPSLVLSRAVPQRNILAILLDDSRSMQIADQGGQARLEVVQGAFADSSALVAALGDRFALRFYRVDGSATPITGSSALTGTGHRTAIASALADVRDALADAPLAGIVLVSDGADNASSDLARELLALAARGIPVHTVGVGTPRLRRDVAVEAVRLPESVLEGGEAVGEVVVRLRGVGGERATFTLEAAGRLVHVDTLRLPDDQDLAAIPIRVPPLVVGVHELTASVTPLEGEVIAANNAGTAVLRVRAGPEKILHVEGEPRAELPFLRRAAATDSALQVVTLLRSAPGKYLRLGVDDSLDLVGGFPTTREALFRYRAIVLGSVEAAFFTADQLRMLEEFVGVRGGGLFVLGGRRALAEGGYGGTALGTVLPIVLDGVTALAADAPAMMWQAVPTAAGARHPALALAVTPGLTVAQWGRLPMISTVNALAAPRPGATVLLEGRDSLRRGARPLLVTHRYGAGQVAVLGAQDLWRWELNATVPDSDASLAALWPRMLRWMLDGVPTRVEVTLTSPLVNPGETGTATVQVRDASFQATDRVRPVVRLMPPDAPAVELPLIPVLGAVGRYAVRIPTVSEGAYHLEVLAVADGDSVRAPPTALRAALAVAEPGSSERDDALLQDLAAQTGGRAFDVTALEELPDAVTLTRAGITVREANDLWDAPLFLLLLLGVVVADWTIRRRRGLA